MTSAGTRIRYMGNKVALASDVAEILKRFDPAWPLVDLFAGMCSIAGAASQSGRRVLVNDVQRYAQLVGYCLVASQQAPPSRERAIQTLLPTYRRNLLALRTRFEDDLATERRILSHGDVKRFRESHDTWRHAGNDPVIAAEVARLRQKAQGPHRLATLTFAWGYFGLQQSIEIDSLRAAIDGAIDSGDVARDEAAWYRLALLQACSRVASAPGHFAQYLRGTSEASFRRIATARRRSIWDGTLNDLEMLAPYGTRRWRRRNQVLGVDALEIGPALDRAKMRGPALYYADPPYSKEQYSRFYHVLETLERYDYPEAHGAGRYRPDRFFTPLSHRAGVLNSSRSMFAQIADRRGTLILSYPSSGLLTAGLGLDIGVLLREYFDNVEEAIARPSRHSTLGSRHGRAQQDVTEFVWIAG